MVSDWKMLKCIKLITIMENYPPFQNTAIQSITYLFLVSFNCCFEQRAFSVLFRQETYFIVALSRPQTLRAMFKYQITGFKWLK